MAIIEKPNGRISLSATPAEALREQQPVMEIDSSEFAAGVSSAEVEATMERVEHCQVDPVDEVGQTRAARQ